MKAIGLALFLATPPMIAEAQEVALTAETFAAIVEGKTFETFGSDGLLGVETFLPDRKTIWRDAERCLHGSWQERDGMICYQYEEAPGTFCSSFFDRGGWLVGWRDGLWGGDPLMLKPARDAVNCEGFLGA